MSPRTKSIEVPDTAAELKLEPLPLRTADRCDQDCPAQAMVRTVKDNELVLDWCGHHYATHEPALMGKGFVVYQDIRKVLLLSNSDVPEATGV